MRSSAGWLNWSGNWRGAEFIMRTQGPNVWADRIGGGVLIALLLLGAFLGSYLFDGGRASFLMFIVFPLVVVWLVWSRLISRRDRSEDGA